MAERIARGIVPKWTNVSAANTMEYENALNAAMLEGHGSVVGLLHAMYTGDVDESQEGYLKYQLLKLEQSSDGEGANAEGEELDWGADPMALLRATQEHDVKMKAPAPNSMEMKAHRAMCKKFCRFMGKVVRHSTAQSNRHALSDMLDEESEPYPVWATFFRDQMAPRSAQNNG